MPLTNSFRLSRNWQVLIVVLICTLSIRAEEAAQTSVIAPKLQPFVDSHSLAGAVTLVATKGQILCLEAVGFADIAAKRAMKTDDIFWIASQSKPITATALMMLVDEGKVNVEDPVEKYLPEFKGQAVLDPTDKDKKATKAPKHPILVRNILSHTSGLPFASPMEKPTLDQKPLSERVASYAKLTLNTEPDEAYKYSNAGINTAGRIIEVVSGMPYEEFLQKRLFDPLGMKDTTFWPNEAQVARIAKSYKPNKEKNDLEEIKISQLAYPLSDRTRQPMPAGGLFSTATDCARFCQMLLNGGEFDGKRYISEASLKQMTSKQTGALKDNYGFGFSTGGGNFGHGGAEATNMSVDPKSGLVYVWMVQHAGFPGEGGKSQDVFQKIAKTLAK